MRNGKCEYAEEPICPYIESCRAKDYSALNRDALELLKEQEEISWTKCTDKLPDAKGEYLVVKSIMGMFNKIDVCAFTQNLNGIDEFDFPTENRPGWYEYDSETGYFEWTGITHWAKLPQMPDEK